LTGGNLHGWTADGERAKLLRPPGGSKLLAGTLDPQGPFFATPTRPFLRRKPDQPLHQGWDWDTTPATTGRATTAVSVGSEVVAVEADGRELAVYGRSALGQVRLRRRVAVGRIRPGAEQVECLAHIGGSMPLAIIGHQGPGRAIFVLPAPRSWTAAPWRVERGGRRPAPQ
jgi:hypothetical protein